MSASDDGRRDGEPSEDVDAAFAEIVAAYEREASDAEAQDAHADPTPEAPDDAAAGPDTGGHGDDGPSTPRTGPTPPPGIGDEGPDVERISRAAFSGWEPPMSRADPPRRADDARSTGGPPPPEERWRGYSVDDDEHFVPPTPPPLPAGDLGFWAILIGLLGGPLVLVLHVGFGLGTSPVWAVLGVGLTLVGIGLLIARLPRDRDPDDHGNGAQV